MSVLNFTDVSFGYPGCQPVLSGFSARLELGEIVCIIGSSGCGKTTLLNLAGGFLKPVSGIITDHEGPVNKPSPDRIMVFQDLSQLFPWLTVTDNVLFPLKAAGGLNPDDRNRAAELLELVGLSDSADKYPAKLSGGMKQRAAIARALAASPEMLLLDEPFTALDAPTRRGLQDMLLNLNVELDVSMLFVTHDIREAVYLADRLLIMTADGVVQQPVELERGAGKRDEFSDEFVRVERAVYRSL